MDTDELTSRLGLSGREERTLADVSEPESSTQTGQTEQATRDRGFYLGRAVLRSQRITRDLAKQFPQLILLDSNERLIVPLMEPPRHHWNEKPALAKADKIKRGLPSARANLDAVPVEQALWHTTVGGTNVIQARIIAPQEGVTKPDWAAQLDDELAAVREVAGGAGLRSVPEAITVAVTEDAGLAAEAANYLDQAGFFDEGFVTLSGLQVCRLPRFDTSQL